MRVTVQARWLISRKGFEWSLDLALPSAESAGHVARWRVSDLRANECNEKPAG
jgi:hypothetical protein